MRNIWGDDYDDFYGHSSYYTPTYKPVKKSTISSWKTKYKGGWSKSWSSFSFIEEYKDNDENLFVKDPVSYLTPTASEIRKKVSAKKQTSIDTIKELARVCYFKMIDEKDYVSEKYQQVELLSDEQQVVYHQKKTLFDSIFEQYIPGFTPLEQAISIFLKLKKEGGGDKSNDGSEDDEKLQLKNALDFDRSVYADPEINEQLELNELSKDRKMEILNLLSLVGKFGSEFKVEKEISEKIVSNSDEHSKMIMRDYSQFFMLDLYQKMFPNFRTKFLTKDLTVNVPVDRKEQLQKIIIILDFSGSMDDTEKQIWVNAILIDRFKYVMKGEAEVFFSYFVHNPEQLHFQHIKDRDDVIKFWQTFSNHPNGGFTEVGKMVEHIANEIENKRLCNLDVDLSEERPEILVINDGLDDIGVEEFPYKVNALSLFCLSDELKNLCIKTGGRQIEIDSDSKIFSHTKDVCQEIKS